MSTLIQQIEAMRVRMNSLVTEEDRLVTALGTALTGADEKLLADVRSVIAAHEARRVTILKELQMLAGRMGMLPSPTRGPSTTLETVPVPELSQKPALVEAAPVQEPLPTPEPVGGGRGDWRQATANIEDYLARQLKTLAG
jgi:hypothetical protein